MTAAKLPDTGPAGLADDTGDGLQMLFVLTAAVLTSTVAVALIALVGTWWMLGFGFAIHVIMTVVVVVTIVHVMAGRARSIAERDRPLAVPDRRLEARPQARTRPVTGL